MSARTARALTACVLTARALTVRVLTTRALVLSSSCAGRRICMLHAITKHGPLATKDASGVPVMGDEFVKCKGGVKLQPREMPPGEHTAEYLFEGKTKSKDYHDQMNNQNFQEWVETRLVPTFEVEFPGKIMILVLDNAQYHHNIALPNLNDLKKKDTVDLLKHHGSFRMQRERARSCFYTYYAVFSKMRRTTARAATTRTNAPVQPPDVASVLPA